MIYGLQFPLVGGVHNGREFVSSKVITLQERLADTPYTPWSEVLVVMCHVT